MKISIIVPVYNAEAYIEECILSVINQTNENWELILVDDGSTDESGNICDEYSLKYKNIKVLHKENQGQFLARQAGINIASGDYIGFLDADDTLSESYTEILSKYIEQYNDLDAICFNFCEENQGKYQFREIIKQDDSVLFDNRNIEVLYENIVDGRLPGAMWAKVFRKSHIEKTKIKTEIVKDKRYAEDTFHSFSLLLNAKKVLFLGQSLYIYKINVEGASQGFSSRDLSYFNSKYVFDLLQEITIANKELSDKLFARNFNETVYYILNFFRTAKTNKRKLNIIEYDWSSYLMEYDNYEIYSNKYIRKSYIKVWDAFMKKKKVEIFVRENFLGW